MLGGTCVAPVMAATPTMRVRAPWGWPKVEIDLEVTLGLCNPMSVVQRLLPFSDLTAITAVGPPARYKYLKNPPGVFWTAFSHRRLSMSN